MKIQLLKWDQISPGFIDLVGEIEGVMEPFQWSMVKMNLDGATNILQTNTIIGSEPRIVRFYLYTRGENILIRIYKNDADLETNYAERQIVIHSDTVDQSDQDGNYSVLIPLDGDKKMPVLFWRHIWKLITTKLTSYINRSVT